MHAFFTLLALLTTALLVVAAFFGFVADPVSVTAQTLSDGMPPLLLHFYFGLVATVAALITHVWVFFYFIGTGEGIREGVITHHMDEAIIKRTKKFKAKTFPFALFSMIFLITAAVMGGALRFEKISPWLHQLFVWAGIAFNLFSFYQEYRIIQENRNLMNELNAQIL